MIEMFWGLFSANSVLANDIMDNAYITLVGNEYFGDIQCYFNEKSVVAKLSKGKKITVIGSCSGLMINVQINNGIASNTLKF